jgi:DNA/RNA endonuclease YhcR with UshA esterase domain
MISVPLKDIISKIVKHTGLSESDIQQQIKTKIEQLYGLVSEEGAAHIIANEHGIKLLEVSGDLKIKDVLIGMKSVDIYGKVLRKYELREFNTEKRKGKVANLMLGDETGTIRVVFWNDKTNDFIQIKEEDIVKIKGAYVRDNAGRKELHLGDNSHIIINPANITVITRERKEYAKKHIKELEDGMSAEIMGTILQVFDVKFFEVCPKCNKRLRLREDQFACDEHGTQTPVYNYVLNVYLDDGTGNIRAIFWKQQSQRLLKLTDNEFNAIRIAPELFEKYKTEMLGVQVKILGMTKNNMMGRMEFNSEIVFTDLNPDHEIELLDHMREVALETRPLTGTPNTGNSNSSAENIKPLTSATERAKQIAQATKPEGDDEFEISEDFLE